MRFIVLLFGFLGCLLTAATGGACFFLDLVINWGNSLPADDPSKGAVTQMVEMLTNMDKDPARTGFFLFIAAGFGLLGTLFGFCRCGWQGSLLMFVPLIGPAILNPITLAGTSLQAFTALISLFVGPSPITPPDEDDDD